MFDINVHANWRLIRTLDPLLKLSEAGRALFVTSDAAHAETAYWGPFAASKAALEASPRPTRRKWSTRPCASTCWIRDRCGRGTRAKAFPGEDKAHLAEPDAVAAFALAAAAASATENGTVVRYRAKGTSAAKPLAAGNDA